jgi:demethylmenaquinone methyltransferase/2-methoxy-6-polyprenyl-1,4-benzoquinol methylase
VKRPDQREALEKYRQLAPTYDRLADLTARMRRVAVDRAELSRGDAVIDLGCGTGLSFPLIEEKIGPQGSIVGIDLSGEMLAIARQRVERSGWSNVSLIEASAEEAEVPLPADALVSVLTHDVMRSRQALENVVGRVKPDGRVSVSGAKWAPRWALPVNVVVRLVARRYVTTFEGFDRPWSVLDELVPGLKVRPILFGGAYVAWGRVPGE